MSSDPTPTAYHPPIELAEQRERRARRVRAGSPAPDAHFIDTVPGVPIGEAPVAQQQRRARPDFGPHVRPAFLWSGGIALLVCLFALITH